MALQHGPSLDMATMDIDGVNNNVIKTVKDPDSIQFSGLYDASGQPKMINKYPTSLEEYFSEPTDTLKKYLDGEEYDGSNLKDLVNKVEKKLAMQINSGEVFGQIFKSSVEDVEKSLKIAHKYASKNKVDEKFYELSKILIKTRQ